MTTNISTKLLLLSVLIFLLLAVGCRQDTALSPEEAGITITLTIDPEPATVGEATATITVTDEQGDPVEVEAITVRGDMSHAGMQPVISEAGASGTGEYTLPYEWTMSGAWFVVVTVTLPDGVQVEQTFDYTVSGQ